MIAYKHTLCEQRVNPYVQSKEKSQAVLVRPRYPTHFIDNLLGAVKTRHMLVNLKPNSAWSGSTDAHCYFFWFLIRN